MALNNSFCLSLVNKELLATGKFELMNRKTDEDEHSIEMQLSYVAKVMER
jgi:predicted class III extradiol MEMO1 family dioxygenase